MKALFKVLPALGSRESLEGLIQWVNVYGSGCPNVFDLNYRPALWIERLAAFVWSRVTPGVTSLRFYNLARLIPVQCPQRVLEGIETHGFDQMMIHAGILRT